VVSDTKSLSSLLNRLGLKKSPQPTTSEGREFDGDMAHSPDPSLRRGNGNGVIHLPPLTTQASLPQYPSTSSARASFGQEAPQGAHAQPPSADSTRQGGGGAAPQRQFGDLNPRSSAETRQERSDRAVSSPPDTRGASRHPSWLNPETPQGNG